MKGKRKQKEPITAILLATLTFLLLISWILYIDITKGNLISEYSDPQINTEFYRGSIYAEDGNILAIDVPAYEIHFNGKAIREPARIASLIAPYTDLDPMFLERLLKNNQGNGFSIPSKLSSSSREEFDALLKDENLGTLITIEKTIEREYPFKQHGEFLVGRTHRNVGISGSEKLADKILQPPLVFRGVVSKGQDVTLAMDMELQYAVETVMTRLIPKKQGHAILAVLDRNTLEILALDEREMAGRGSYLEILRKILGPGVTMLSSDVEEEMPECLPSVMDGEYVFHHLSDRYLIISISTNEKTASTGLGALVALLETREMI